MSDDVAARPRVLGLCVGAGGLELGVKLLLPRARLVCGIERDSYAAAVLVERMGEKALGEAPVWDDVTTFDGAPWRGTVDLVVGGFPCQPFSAAGRRGGTDDARWIWPDIARVIGDVGPGVVFLENVPPLLRPFRRDDAVIAAAVGAVLGDLADLGFDAEWAVLPASAVGAPHRRERVFILGWRGDVDDAARCLLGDGCQDDAPAERGRATLQAVAAAAGAVAHPSGAGDRGQVFCHQDVGPGSVGSAGGPGRPGGEDVADSGRQRRQQVAGGAHGDEAPDEGRTSQHGDQPQRGGETVAHVNRRRRRGEGLHATEDGDIEPGRDVDRPGRADRAGAIGVFAPGPDDRDRWAELLEIDPGLEPALLRAVDGMAAWMDGPLAFRLDRLRVVGNGVVPLAAGAALALLGQRAGIWDLSGSPLHR